MSRRKHVLGLTPEPSGAGGYRWPDWIVQQIDGQPSRHGDLFAAIHHMDLSNAVSRRLALRLPDGTRRFLSLQLGPCRNGVDGVDFVLSASDITELEETAEQLRRLADEDPLTGVYNRRGLAAAVDAALPPNHPDPAPFASAHDRSRRFQGRERHPAPTMPANAVLRRGGQLACHKAVRPGGLRRAAGR